MDSVIAFVANYLLWFMVAGLAAVWLLAEPREGKARLAVGAIVGLVVALVLLYVAGKLHTDPRPFVQNPHLKPLIKHSADNGFPSDHSVAAGLIAALVTWRHWRYSLVFWVAAGLVAAARVAAHVHHVQDVVAGLLLGAVGAAIGAVVATWLLDRYGDRVGLPAIETSRAVTGRHGSRAG